MGKWSSRKFWVAILTFVVATALLFNGDIDAAQWQWITSITIGAYLGSQGLADALAALKQR